MTSKSGKHFSSHPVLAQIVGIRHFEILRIRGEMRVHVPPILEFLRHLGSTITWARGHFRKLLVLQSLQKKYVTGSGDLKCL
jgi:hypothetical protein